MAAIMRLALLAIIAVSSSYSYLSYDFDSFEPSAFVQCHSTSPDGMTHAKCPCRYDYKYQGWAIDCRFDLLADTGIPQYFESPVAFLEMGDNVLGQVMNTDFDNYPEIQAIGLDNTSLAFFDANAIVHLINLTEMTISNNPGLKKMPIFPKSTLRLDISQTGYVLGSTGDLDLKDLNLPASMEYIRITNSSLTAFPKNIPADVEQLFLNNNEFTAIGDLGYLFSLFRLDMDYNQIKTLEGDPALPPTLVELNLRYNHIMRIDTTYFHMLDKIEILQINNNDLSYVSPQAFQGLDLRVTSDTYVRIEFENNPLLTNISEEVFDPFIYGPLTQYKELNVRLEGSKINCECEMKWIPELMASTDKDIMPEEITIDGSCYSPPDLAGRSFASLSPDDIKCPITGPPNPSPADSGANGWAIFLGLMLIFVSLAFVGYIIWQKKQGGYTPF